MGEYPIVHTALGALGSIFGGDKEYWHNLLYNPGNREIGFPIKPGGTAWTEELRVLAAIVGGVGLMTTMSINVVERGREIGVMRAIGATSASILGVFIVEGVLVGVLSWLLAMPLSYPGARAFSGVIGKTLFELPLDFQYSVGGGVLWLVVVVVLSALASLWPALNATRVSVREALAYE